MAGTEDPRSMVKILNPKSRSLPLHKLEKVYHTLRRALGHQHWWPGESPFEIMVGAILTQNTTWTNVEKAIRNLKQVGKLSPQALRSLSNKELAELIRPSGYFNVKALRLKSYVDFLYREYSGNLRKMSREAGPILREKLLAVKGIGSETADSILLYAFGKPFFVIDAYTRRIFSRHRLSGKKTQSLLSLTYAQWQNLLTRAIPRKTSIYNDFHAQIVAIGKNFCKASFAKCQSCPLSIYL